MVGPFMKPPSTTIKFLCSYGGKILPRYPDGKLRYHGGETRVLAVDRSISFAELLVKLGEMCGTSVSLRCQLPTEDLDALVSITSDEDLANLIEEYDHHAASSPSATIKIRAFLSPPKSAKKISPSPSTASSSSNDATSPKSSCSFSTTARMSASSRCSIMSTVDRGQILATKVRSTRHVSRPMVLPVCYEKAVGKLPQYAYHGHGNYTSHMYLIHNGNHWQ